MDFIIANDGTRIAYYVRGEGFPIFIFNGFTCSEANLKPIVNLLSKKYKVIYWDYKGHGMSGTPRSYKEVTVAGSVDDARRVLEKLNVKKAIFLGYSTGAQIMFEYNFRYPEVANSLISIAGFSDRVMDSFLNLDTTVFGQLGEALKKLSPVVRNPDCFPIFLQFAHAYRYYVRFSAFRCGCKRKNFHLRKIILHFFS